MNENQNSIYEFATFGGGCFWCIEAVFRQIKGVVETVVGYSGGSVVEPTYEQVCTGATGHAEVCQIKFDPKFITYNDLLEIFFLSHDPTSLNRQGADVGTQYRSVIFYHNELQKKQALDYIHKLEKENNYKNTIVTEVLPLINFYRAETYHQNYFEKNPESAYCIFTVLPKVEKIRKFFISKLK